MKMLLAAAPRSRSRCRAVTSMLAGQVCRARRCDGVGAGQCDRVPELAIEPWAVVWVIVVEVSASWAGVAPLSTVMTPELLTVRWQRQLGAGIDFEVPALVKTLLDGGVLVLDLVAAAGDMDVAGEVGRARRC